MENNKINANELFPKLVVCGLSFKFLYDLVMWFYDYIGFIKIGKEVSGDWFFYLVGVYAILKIIEIINNTIRRWDRKRRGLE